MSNYKVAICKQQEIEPVRWQFWHVLSEVT